MKHERSHPAVENTTALCPSSNQLKGQIRRTTSANWFNLQNANNPPSVIFHCVLLLSQKNTDLTGTILPYGHINPLSLHVGEPPPPRGFVSTAARCCDVTGRPWIVLAQYNNRGRTTARGCVWGGLHQFRS